MCFEHFRREREEALNRQGGMEKWATQRWRGWWHVRMLEDVLAWAQQGGQRCDGTALAVATCTAALAEVGGCARQSGGITLHMRK